MIDFIMSYSPFTLADLLSVHELEFFKLYAKAQVKMREKMKAGKP